MAPEIVFRQNHDFQADFFGVGVILHEIMMGFRPYPATDRAMYREQVAAKQVVLTKKNHLENWSLEALDFINKCIRRDPKARIGLNGIAELKAHVWLKDVEWKRI